MWHWGRRKEATHACRPWQVDGHVRLCLCVLEKNNVGGELPGREKGADWAEVLERFPSVVLVQDTQNVRD